MNGLGLKNWILVIVLSLIIFIIPQIQSQSVCVGKIDDIR